MAGCCLFPCYFKIMIKGLELISSVELAFGSCLTGAINMKSQEISTQVKAEKTKQIYQIEQKKL